MLFLLCTRLQQAMPSNRTATLFAAPPLAHAAPCVSKYTLDFLRQMAFNLTEGQTYAGAHPRVCCALANKALACQASRGSQSVL